MLILTVDETYVSHEMQAVLSRDSELRVGDVAKIIGCYRALREQGKGEEGEPLKRAVAFSGTIKNSKQISKQFQKVVDELDEIDNDGFTCKTKHVDGTHSALERNRHLDWLRKDPGRDENGEICHILSNARCLTEGVDIPALDAILFMAARRSPVDVVQAVGRVMRKAKNKAYGYIILPVVIPSGMEPEEALNDNKTFAVVWEVLRALRSHDNKLNAVINTLDLNQSKPDNIQIIGIPAPEPTEGKPDPLQLQLNLSSLNEAIYAKIVLKCGSRRYWQEWAEDVANIFNTVVGRVNNLSRSEVKVKQTLDRFLVALRKNVHKNLTLDQAISMLAQHLITEPIFNALFKNYNFAAKNAVSKSMDRVLKSLHQYGLANELKDIEGFYEDVRERASGIKSVDGRQKVINELYEQFFKTAFAKEAKSLGIAYTPIEVVDFILHSVDDCFKHEFGRSISDRDVRVLDPFVGTGTFISRLIANSKLISAEDIKRKYSDELLANDVELLAYYIAAVSIEEAYHGRLQQDSANLQVNYQSFPGVVLTDTFNLTEKGKGSQDDMLDDILFPENDARIKKQLDKPIEVIIGNPPWSKGQESENDANKNRIYQTLDKDIRENYARYSSATNKNSLYDSYIRAVRWASDRLSEEGIIGFVVNGGFLESSSSDGLRKCLEKEFAVIHIYNLRGNALSRGETRKREGGNVFGSSSRAKGAIVLLIKKAKPDHQPAEIYYYDIGDYLSREEKLKLISSQQSIYNLRDKAQRITPNAHGDWLNQRDPRFDTFKAVGSKEVKQGKLVSPNTLFLRYSRGVITCRDAWVYNFNKDRVASNMSGMINFYNEQLQDYRQEKTNNSSLKLEDFISNDEKLIKWDRALKKDLARYKTGRFSEDNIRKSLYYPFMSTWLYFDRQFNSDTYRQPSFFPDIDSKNTMIVVTGISASEFSSLIVNQIPSVHFIGATQCFPRYFWDRGERLDNIPSQAVRDFNHYYGRKDINGDDVFYYVYGLLHSPHYRQRFASNLSKELPRIPYAPDFDAFRGAGFDLAQLHLNFDDIEEYPLTLLVKDKPELSAQFLTKEDYKVEKMQWLKSADKNDPSSLKYNGMLTLTGIPKEAHQYIVNARSALQGLIDYYQIKTEKKSGIVNDPNHWIEAQGDPTWLIKHIKRICYLSVETVRITNSLPKEFMPADEGG